MSQGSSEQTSPPRTHALSVDVEDWYHDAPFNGDGDGSRAGTADRVERNTMALLELLASAGARATLFFLGEVAESYPQLVRRAADAGHEIGSHGYHHRAVSAWLRREFRDDVSHSLGVIEDACGRRVHGYRAPYFSIRSGVRWPLETLQELGLRYDSSILPIDRPPGLDLVCPRVPYRHENGLWEVPVAILQIGPFWHLPLASGAGLRLLPPRLLDRWVRRFERDVGSGVFYLHPWELDPGSPTAPQGNRWILRVGRHRLAERLANLMKRVRFAPIGEVFDLGDGLNGQGRSARKGEAR